MNFLLHLHNLLKPELKQLEQAITAHYKATNIKLIQQVVENLFFSGGKRMRPILMFLLAQLLNYTKPNIVPAAAAIELIHTATLLHDDVVDDADMRRGAQTARSIWGNKTSILVGDFLLSSAFNSAIKCNNHKVLEILSEATLIIAEGEVQQLINVGNIFLTYEDYMEVISAKTAKLFSASCAIVAALTEQNITVWEQFGHSLGMAFQVVDDVIDYQKHSGKDYAKDFHNSKVTLPVIIAYQQSNHSEQALFGKMFQEGEKDIATAIKQIEKYDGFKEALKVAHKHINQCNEIVNTHSENSETQKLLSQLLMLIVERTL